MSTAIAPPRRLVRPARHTRREERRRLRRLDALSALLAELGAVRPLLEQSAELVARGWIQDAWFTVSTGEGARVVSAYDLRLAVDRPVVGACLVGAVVQAAGGPHTVRTQLVQRTLDLTWHTLREDPAEPVRWCPGPHVRMIQVRDLTHWNDTPGRTQEEVVELLRSAGHAADVQQGLHGVEHAELARA